MGENFMTAGTQIESLVEKKKEIYDKAANLLAEAMMERTNTSTVNMNTKKDILNIIKGFTPDEQVEVRSTALISSAVNLRESFSCHFPAYCLSFVKIFIFSIPILIHNRGSLVFSCGVKCQMLNVNYYGMAYNANQERWRSNQPC